MMVHLRLIKPALSFLCPGRTLGVDVFFALSGFLITSLLLKEADLTQGIDLKRFYIRRALRLLFRVYYGSAICFADRFIGRLP